MDLEIHTERPSRLKIAGKGASHVQNVAQIAVLSQVLAPQSNFGGDATDVDILKSHSSIHDPGGLCIVVGCKNGRLDARSVGQQVFAMPVGINTRGDARTVGKGLGLQLAPQAAIPVRRQGAGQILGVTRAKTGQCSPSAPMAQI